MMSCVVCTHSPWNKICSVAHLHTAKRSIIIVIITNCRTPKTSTCFLPFYDGVLLVNAKGCFLKPPSILYSSKQQITRMSPFSYNCQWLANTLRVTVTQYHSLSCGYYAYTSCILCFVPCMHAVVATVSPVCIYIPACLHPLRPSPSLLQLSCAGSLESRPTYMHLSVRACLGRGLRLLPHHHLLHAYLLPI